MRWCNRGLLIAVLTWLLTYIGYVTIKGHDWSVALITLAAILSANSLLALAEWILFEPLGLEYQRTRLALRQAELTFGIALGDLSSARSPRKWWRPLYQWRLKRKLARKSRPEAS